MLLEIEFLTLVVLTHPREKMRVLDVFPALALNAFTRDSFVRTSTRQTIPTFRPDLEMTVFSAAI
jgi:hypothetical protein